MRLLKYLIGAVNTPVQMTNPAIIASCLWNLKQASNKPKLQVSIDLGKTEFFCNQLSLSHRSELNVNKGIIKMYLTYPS